MKNSRSPMDARKVLYTLIIKLHHNYGLRTRNYLMEKQLNMLSLLGVFLQPDFGQNIIVMKKEKTALLENQVDQNYLVPKMDVHLLLIVNLKPHFKDQVWMIILIQARLMATLSHIFLNFGAVITIQ